MMTNQPSNQRVQKHRDALREAGLRPVQFWVMDTRRSDFAKIASQQCLLANQADAGDHELDTLLEDALSDIDHWNA